MYFLSRLTADLDICRVGKIDIIEYQFISNLKKKEKRKVTILQRLNCRGK